MYCYIILLKESNRNILEKEKKRVRKKKMERENKRIEKQVENIIEVLEEKIKKIMAIEYHYNLDELFKEVEKVGEKEKYKIYEGLINYYLEKIRGMEEEKIREGGLRTEESKVGVLHEIENIIEFFDEEKGSEERIDERGEEASVIAFDLIAKVLGKNKRKLNLPLKIENIKDFSVASTIKEKEMHELFFQIILNLSVVFHYINNLKN